MQLRIHADAQLARTAHFFTRRTHLHTRLSLMFTPIEVYSGIRVRQVVTEMASESGKKLVYALHELQKL
jgi:hypothetical protein